jgi:hypothetical protein
MSVKADLVESVPIELDKTRHLKFTNRAMMAAEREINKQRGASVAERVAIDYLMIAAARQGLSGAGSFPRDLVTVMIWAGLLREDPSLTVEQVVDLIDRSPLSRGKILDCLWEAYQSAASKTLASAEEPEGGDPPPLAQPPGSNSGA